MAGSQEGIGAYERGGEQGAGIVYVTRLRYRVGDHPSVPIGFANPLPRLDERVISLSLRRSRGMRNHEISNTDQRVLSLQHDQLIAKCVIRDRVHQRRHSLYLGRPMSR
jgi:hypothetical protein